MDKKSLIKVAQSACQAINAKNSHFSNSSASIYTLHEDKIDCIAHSGIEDCEDVVFDYQKTIYRLKSSSDFQEDFHYLKVRNENRHQFSIPLRNKNSIFAFLKIETEYGIVHPAEEHHYYKDMSATLSEILLLAQEREHFEQIHQQNVRLIDEMSSAAIGIDKYDLVTHWNNQAETYFGINSDKAIGARLFDLNIKCDWPTLISKLYESSNKNITSERFDFIYKRADTEEDRILSVAITPFKEAAIEKGMIKIQTLSKDDFAEIRISDNGGGIPLAIQEKIFDPFFYHKRCRKRHRPRSFTFL